MSTKRIVIGTFIGLSFLLFFVTMAWQVAPATAGFVPTSTNTAVPTATNTAVPSPTSTPVPASNTSSPSIGTPGMPNTGADLSGRSNSGIILVFLAGALILLLVAVSLGIHESAKTKTEK